MRSSLSLLLVSILLFAGCKIQYSFTGINVNAETITINNFFFESDNGPPDLATKFTDQMRDYFQQNTNLQLIDNDGELMFEGAVSGYQLSPVAQTANTDLNGLNTAAQTRLTITVSVNFTNLNDPSSDFTRNFSFFSDFDADQAIQDVEEELIDEIYEQIILNIFNASVANW